MKRVTESTVPNKGLRVAEPGKWTSTLFSCFTSIEEADEEGCEWVLVCPSIMHARIANRLRNDSYRMACCTYALTWAYCAWLFAAPVRKELRAKYDLPEEPCSDSVAHLFCSPCATWQEYRELEAREGMHFYLTPNAGFKQDAEGKAQEGQQQSAQGQQQQQQPVQGQLEGQVQEFDHASKMPEAPAASTSQRPPGPVALPKFESYRKRSVEIEEAPAPAPAPLGTRQASGRQTPGKAVGEAWSKVQ